MTTLYRITFKCPNCPDSHTAFCLPEHLKYNVNELINNKVSSFLVEDYVSAVENDMDLMEPVVDEAVKMNAELEKIFKEFKQ